MQQKPSVHTQDVVVFQPGVHTHCPTTVPRSVLYPQARPTLNVIFSHIKAISINDSSIHQFPEPIPTDSSQHGDNIVTQIIEPQTNAITKSQ